MNTGSKTVQERAEASFKKKERQLEEGQKARAEYEANSRAVLEKTAKLRALRLAHEARETATAPSPKKPAASSGKTKR